MFNYKSNSRENQDLFILYVLNKKRNGIYVEIGANHPITDNNTFLLESEFDWKGVSIEWNVNLCNLFNLIRKNPCIAVDATTTDYDMVFQLNKFPSNIDYLQLDVDPPSNTLKALKLIDFNKYSFSVITYEHDLYAGGKLEREESRNILESYGYTRVISDVMHKDLTFEDWYVNEKHMIDDRWKNLVGENVSLNVENLSEKYINLFKQL